MVSMETSMKLLFPTVAPLDEDNKKFVGIFKHGEVCTSVCVRIG